MDKREGHVEAVSHGCGTLGAASVWGYDHKVGDVEVFSDPFHNGGLAVEVVDGNAEEALDLGGMEVDRNDVVLFSVSLGPLVSPREYL